VPRCHDANAHSHPTSPPAVFQADGRPRLPRQQAKKEGGSEKPPS
jgi:hypothetical protein